jgi:hypothetical protein
MGGFWVWFSVPESAGRSFKTMDQLCELPWHKIGLYGSRDAEERKMVVPQKEQVAGQSVGTAEHIKAKDTYRTSSTSRV